MTAGSHGFCVDLVEYVCSGRRVWPGRSVYGDADVWVASRDLRDAAKRRSRRDDRPVPDKFGVATLRSAAKAGVIAAREFGDGRNSWRFTTLALAEAWDAERGLSDGERAERTAAAVRSMYEANRVEYGDRVALWPVSTNLAAVPQDGIGRAVDGGLVRSVKTNGGVGLVPAECWDAYEQANAAAVARQTRLRERHTDLVEHLHVYTEGDARNLRSMTIDQMDRLLCLIELDKRKERDT